MMSFVGEIIQFFRGEILEISIFFGKIENSKFSLIFGRRPS